MQLKRLLAVIVTAAALAVAVALFVTEGIVAAVVFLALASLLLLRTSPTRSAARADRAGWSARADTNSLRCAGEGRKAPAVTARGLPE
jgi:hypothetical protein